MAQDNPMTPLTDTQLAAIAEQAPLPPWGDDSRERHTIRALIASHRSLAVRLAEAERQRDHAERWYTEAMATFEVFRKQHITLTDQLATAQAAIARLTTALEGIQRYSRHSYHWEGSMREEEVHDAPCAKCLVEVALAPPAPEADTPTENAGE